MSDIYLIPDQIQALAALDGPKLSWLLHGKEAIMGELVDAGLAERSQGKPTEYRITTKGQEWLKKWRGK